jgi:hypothetical protein
MAQKAGMEVAPEMREFAKQRRSLVNDIGQQFNAYRKEITGAAAALGELEQLKETFINKDLSYDEFVSALDQYESKQKRALRLSRRILREGVKVGSSKFGDMHDRLWATGADDDIDTRGDELSAQGLSDDQVVQKLQKEGYF